MKFIPVQCTNEKFQSMNVEEGWVYFVTDKKQIFLGKDGKKIPFCNSSGIFYGKKPIEYDNSGNEPDPNVTFIFDSDENMSEIEGADKPELDDLILNIGVPPEFKDGCFYRVVNIVDNTIETTRLTLQGTGGGGSGGSSGPGNTSGNFSISIIGNKAKVYSSMAKSMEIVFKAYYNGLEENYISQVTFTKKGDSTPFYSHNERLDFNKEQPIDLFPYMNLFNATNTTVTIAIQDVYGNERSTNFTIQIVELSLTAIQSDLLSSRTDSYNYVCNLSGGTSGVLNKKIIYTLYNENNLNVPVIDPQYRELQNSEQGQIQKILKLNNLPHGVYVLKVQASADIGTSNEKIYSNELVHKIARFDSENNSPLLVILTPEVTEQYTNIPLNYLLMTSETNKEYTLTIKLDGKVKTEEIITSNVANSYNLYFEESGTYTLVCSIPELGLTYQKYLNIVKYTGELPIIDPVKEELMLYLNPRGKSNNAVDKNIWKDTKGNYTAQLNNFHFGSANGWMADETGTNYLYLSSGASLNTPDFYPFGTDPSTNLGMTIELDFEISGVLDYDVEIIKCISLNRSNLINVGFSITGDKIRFYNSRLNGGEKGALMNLNLVEGKRIRLSFVIEPKTIQYPMCYAYLDGKLSGAVIYNSGDSYQDTSEGTPATLQANSSNAQIKIYGIRFYNSALSSKVVLDNYIASLPTVQDRQNKFDSNNVFDANGNIDFVLVSAEEYNLQIPYMKITGGWATEPKAKWQLKGQTNANVGLPTGKKDYRLIDVEVFYPETELFKDYPRDPNNPRKGYECISEFASGKPMATAYGEEPIKNGAIMYAQGTSSMEYPVKNLRLRFKEDDKFFTVRPDIAPVEIICMKADYMESSGSHNTGTANLVDDLYTGVSIATPGQEHFGGANKDTIVTCIKGHPCLIFYSETGESGSYKYIGKYNLNLDKATPEPFGFNHDDSDFGYLKTGEKYYEIRYDDDGTEFVGQKKPTKGGDYIAGQIETEKTVNEGDKINSIHCFEFLDNAVKVCNFLITENKDIDGNTITNYHDTWYNTFWDAKEKREAPGWTLGFESRYPEDRIGYHDADSLYPFASWLNELYILRQTDEDYALARFKNEYECYLDKKFLLTYYLVTEALLMADSRVKNMMIATWGKENKQHYPLKQDNSGKWVTDTSATPIQTNNYILYPIFYDMDTMLGLDNTGVSRFKYYDEDTDSAIYNGDEVLWNFVRDALPNDLISWYSELENSLLTVGKDDKGEEIGILPYYNKNQANMANEAFYNGDAVYKYTDPARKGYRDDLNGQNIAPGAGPYLYAAQGDRSLMREFFIYNRIKFLRGKYASRKYQSGDRVDFRWYYPTGEENDEKLNISRRAVEPDGLFTFTSLKTGYAGVQLGANGNIYNERFDGEQVKTINLTEANSANGTEAYLLGLSTLTDLGDLSNKYMQKFIISSDDVRLKRLTLGNPHKDYYNPYWRPGENQAGQIILTGCTYLEYFNLQNCSTYNNALDFSYCPAIKQILLTGSNTSGLTLPINGFINELRLPTAITDLKIEGHESLTDEGFSLGTYNYGSGNKIGEGGSYVNDFSLLQEIYMSGPKINAYEIVKNAGDLTNYYFKNVEWTATEDDTQYCARSSNEIDWSKSYYTYNPNNKQYELYAETAYPETGMLYEKISMLENNKIVAIPVLDYLLTKDLYKDDKGNYVTTLHSEALSGKLVLDLPSGTSVNELEIYEKYHSKYPNLTILYGSNVNVEGANKIYFYPSDVEGVEPYFVALTANGRYNLADLIATGFNDPVKPDTNYEIFTFVGEWKDQNGNSYYQDSYYPDSDPGVLFSEIYPTTDLHLIPQFTTDPKLFTVNFYDYNYEMGDDPIFTIKGQYENTVGSYAKDYPQSKYLYRSDEDLTGSQRYSFVGWLNEADFNNINNIINPSLVDLNSIKIYNDLNYYAHYRVEDATKVASDSILFEIKNNNAIAVKPDFVKLIAGKVTVPSVLDGINITHLGAFANCDNIEEIYFLPENSYTYINNDSCRKNVKLKHIYLPSTIAYIGDEAFEGDISLELNQLPSSLKTIGNRAFQSCSKISIKTIPNSVEAIGVQSFLSCRNVAISVLGGEGSALKTVGYMAFGNTALEDNTIDNITIHSPVELETVGSDGYRTFNDSYTKNLKTFTTYSDFGYEDVAQLLDNLFGDGSGRQNVTINLMA